jgi:hypothetical protein
MRPIQCFSYSTGRPSVHHPRSSSQHAPGLVARHRKSSTWPTQPATSLGPAANPRLLPSRRPTQSCLVSASRSPVNAQWKSGRGGLARRVSGAKSTPRLGANVLQLLWRAVGGPGSRSRAPEAMWSSLRARLKAEQPGSKRPIL